MANNFIKQTILRKIWKKKPGYVVKAKIDMISIHHGSFHGLKAGRYLNQHCNRVTITDADDPPIRIVMRVRPGCDLDATQFV